MAISMYSASVPVFRQILGGMGDVLERASAHALQVGVEEQVLLEARLFPDFFPLQRQVVIATDFARSCCGRLAGQPFPVLETSGEGLAPLVSRVAASVHYIDSIPKDMIDGSEGREIKYNIGSIEKCYVGETYLLHAVMPQFIFHVSVAYSILRHCGVPIGKKDFLGEMPSSPRSIPGEKI